MMDSWLDAEFYRRPMRAAFVVTVLTGIVGVIGGFVSVRNENLVSLAISIWIARVAVLCAFFVGLAGFVDMLIPFGRLWRRAFRKRKSGSGDA